MEGKGQKYEIKLQNPLNKSLNAHEEGQKMQKWNDNGRPHLQSKWVAGVLLRPSNLYAGLEDFAEVSGPLPTQNTPLPEMQNTRREG